MFKNRVLEDPYRISAFGRFEMSKIVTFLIAFANYPSVTLTRVFSITWVGIPKGSLT